MLSMIFVLESVIMTVLELTAGDSRNRWLGVFIDASVLTIVVAPLMHRVIVRPLRQLADERSRLLAHLMEVQDAERRRVARDLHDGIGQSFTSLLLRLRLLEEATSLDAARSQAGSLRGLSGEIYDQIRALARGLHPAVLDDLGLVEAVRRMTEDFESMQTASVKLHVFGFSKERLPRRLETTAYRIVQESLTNCAKHAHASVIDVTLKLDHDHLTVTVSDDGCGFDSGDVARQAKKATFGLAGMRERALLLNGSFDVRSQPGGGTTVTLKVPAKD
jgi:two-component system sensor histidine kinase UhpB